MSMLQKILQDMFIEQELLDELDEEQKQILFCKMREEQLRRWAIYEKECEEKERINPDVHKRNCPKSLRWRIGADGEPWVWVMGDHKNDPSIDEIIDSETARKAHELAEMEAEKLRQREEEELKEKLRLEENDNDSITLDSSTENLNNHEIHEENQNSNGPSSSHPMTTQAEAGTHRAIIHNSAPDTTKDALPRLPTLGSSITAAMTSNDNRPSTQDKNGGPSFSTSAFANPQTRKSPFSNPTQTQQAEFINRARSINEREQTPTPSNSTIYTNSTNNRNNGPKLFANSHEDDEDVQALMQSLRDAKLTIRKHRSRDPSMSEEEKESELQKERERLEQRLRAEAERRIEEEKERREQEIYQSLKEARDKANKEAEKEQRDEEKFWREQEKKSREAEESVRSIARNARERHRKLSQKSSSPTTNPTPDRPSSSSSDSPKSGTMKLVRPGKPKSRGAIIQWFVRDEIPKRTGLDPKTGMVAPWFHGIISREKAEEILRNRPIGSFLVRVSEKIWGFTLSVTAGSQDVKHFLIERTPDGFQFLGTQQVVHKQLWDLISYHESVPITAKGREILRDSVGQAGGVPDYSELFPPQQQNSYRRHISFQ